MRASAPVVSPVGLVLVVGAMLSLPVSIVLMETPRRAPLSAAEIGIALVFALMALRLVLRIREDGQVTEDLVRNEEDFRDLVESSSDGIAIVDDELNLLFTSPAARRLLGLAVDVNPEGSLVDLLVDEDRAVVRAARLANGGSGELHFRVPARTAARASSRSTPRTVPAAAAACCTCATSPAAVAASASSSAWPTPTT